MKFIKAIFIDISNGENIDVYSTILISAVTVILGLFTTIDNNIINSLILATLCILAISMLQNRNLLKSQMTGVKGNVIFSIKYPNDFDEQIKNCTTLFICGISLTRTTITYYTLLEQKLKKGDKIKVLIVDPESSACGFAVSRHRANDDVNYLKTTIKSSLNKFVDLKKISPSNLEIRIIDYPIIYGVYGLNLDNSSGVLFIENYPFKTENGSLPKFTLNSDNREWFDFYKNELNLLWSNAKIYQP